MNILLAISEKDYAQNLFDAGYNFGEIALFGLMILAIGLMTVFAVLILIWFALIAFEKVFAKQHTSKPKESVQTPISVPAPVAIVETPDNDDEIVAVIAAAIAMAESECSGLKFRVVSFRRK